ncbi:uncharacterized protein EAE97_011912 [Botrytis byssoidea]|uniref:2EXR domain-containing protein n=1 Tax=Botrytis byssoidea TaxID=139641 RepID=A0A9P5HRW4_9HELO|nr:uncharacterized protein EAE97_011912 [Botrytis byssoidea]KAF7918141.1 hypothetical protein EAE97_011912 [Botrytis byssoidea]
MDNTRQDSGSNAHRAAGTPTIQQTSRGTQTGTFTTQVAIAAQFDSFVLFRNLPAELKAKILNIAAREVRRTIEMTPQGNHRGYAPALLGVSRMAREEALKVYNALRPGSSQPIYFNPDNDTLILNIALRTSTISLRVPPALTPIVLPPSGMIPFYLTVPALTPIVLPPPGMIPFSSTAPALGRFRSVVVLDLSNMPDFQEWLISLGIKSFVVRLGY